MLGLCSCQQQQQASRDVGAKPKEIIDKVSDDLNAAQAFANKQLKEAEKESN